MFDCPKVLCTYALNKSDAVSNGDPGPHHPQNDLTQLQLWYSYQIRTSQNDGAFACKKSTYFSLTIAKLFTYLRPSFQTASVKYGQVIFAFPMQAGNMNGREQQPSWNGGYAWVSDVHQLSLHPGRRSFV